MPSSHFDFKAIEYQHPYQMLTLKNTDFTFTKFLSAKHTIPTLWFVLNKLLSICKEAKENFKESHKSIIN